MNIRWTNAAVILLTAIMLSGCGFSGFQAVHRFSQNESKVFTCGLGSSPNCGAAEGQITGEGLPSGNGADGSVTGTGSRNPAEGSVVSLPTGNSAEGAVQGLPTGNPAEGGLSTWIPNWTSGFIPNVTTGNPTDGAIPASNTGGTGGATPTWNTGGTDGGIPAWNTGGTGGAVPNANTGSTGGGLPNWNTGSTGGSNSTSSTAAGGGASDCSQLPSWMSQQAPPLMSTSAPNASQGVLPVIEPRLVSGPWHGNKGPTLANSTNGVYPALYLCSQSGAPISCALVKTWDDPQASLTFAQRLYDAQPFQLTTGSALQPGQYYLVVFPTGTSAPQTIGYTGAAKAVAPMQDSVAENLSTSATFTVNSNGSISGGSQSFNVLLDVRYSSNGAQTASPTFGCYADMENIGEIDPLMIDFSGRGITLSSQTKGIDFDLAGNGLIERISWPVNTGNAFLIYNVPASGLVTGDNMFGNYSVGPDGQVAKDGFEALAKYDSYHDGVIDSRDVIFRQLRLWSDLNRDGRVQSGEMRTLTQMGVVAIELRAVPVNESDMYGNTSTARANVHMTDSSVRIVSDIWFNPTRKSMVLKRAVRK